MNVTDEQSLRQGDRSKSALEGKKSKCAAGWTGSVIPRATFYWVGSQPWRVRTLFGHSRRRLPNVEGRRFRRIWDRAWGEWPACGERGCRR